MLFDCVEIIEKIKLFIRTDYSFVLLHCQRGQKAQKERHTSVWVIMSWKICHCQFTH